LKRRTLTIILIILLVVAGLWFMRGQTADVTLPADQQDGTLVSLGTPGPEEALQGASTDETTVPATENRAALDEQGSYTSKDDVSAYLAQYGKLPENFITKTQAREFGWEGGGLDDYAYGYCIGGDSFGNYEGLLPQAADRSYYECDIDTLHADSRGAKRIVYSSDGLIYYTDDHYESFSLLYGTP
jgi:guanyl-specific ribonuclease Sa